MLCFAVNGASSSSKSLTELSLALKSAILSSDCAVEALSIGPVSIADELCLSSIGFRLQPVDGENFFNQKIFVLSPPLAELVCRKRPSASVVFMC